MPMTPLHVLLWSQDQSRYELYIRQQFEQAFESADATDAWLIWLENATAFAFRGACGSLNVYLETRKRGGHYWYAYHTDGKHTHKRYLGRTPQVTFVRLEEAAHALCQNSSPSPGSQHYQEPDTASDRVVSAPPSETAQGMVLLSTKLAPPLLPSLLVGRDRLLNRLDEARAHRLTLLSASAGWGKTTLLSTWAARCAFPVAWLSLDEMDNGPARFWVSVVAALRTCLPEVGQTALAMLHSHQPPPLSTILTTLLNDLCAQDMPIFLLLDDYHLISEQAIHDSVLFVLDHLPAHLHLVLSSRVDPPFALARLRVRGQLLELL